MTALGKEGLAAYRELASAAWKKIPPRMPGARTVDASDGRYALAQIMKTLANIDGDVDALVEVLRRDLSESCVWLEIAETLSKAKRHDEALKWAEQGRKAFSAHLNVPLDDFLVAEYHRQKRHDDAIALRWTRFTERPSLQTYQDLAAAASQAKSWVQLRDKALALLDKPTVRKARSVYAASWVESHASVLIQISL